MQKELVTRSWWAGHALVLLGLLVIAGCAGMGKHECLQADWRTVGYEDGLNGHSAARIGTHRTACAKHQVTPDLAAYSEGRERGLREFCQPRNGYRAGVNGRAYENVCPATVEPAFLHGYSVGRQIHEAKVELRSAQSQLKSAQDSLAHKEKAADKVKVELVLPDVPAKRRLELAFELERLTEDRRDREAQIRRLTLRTRDLSLALRELEAGNPYAH